MRFRLALLAILVCAPGSPQARITVQQLESWVKSSIQLKHPDVKLAQALRGVKLTEKLDDRTVEEMQGWGVGPKTLAVLKSLRDASETLKEAAPPPPKPVVHEIPPPPYDEQQRILAAVADYAQNYIQRLPDFICTQVTRRYVDTNGKDAWYKMDTITERLTFFDKKEDYKVVLVNNAPSDVAHDKLGGTTSSGEFGTMLKEIFDPETHTDFGWERWTKWETRINYVFSFRVAQPRSKYRIVSFSSPTSHEEYTAGYHGSVYVNKADLKVMRIRMEAEGLPPDFPIQDVKMDLMFDYTKIGDSQFVLPLKAQLTSREGGRIRIKNDVEFRMYRKFGAEAEIKFDTPDPLPPPVEQPAKP